MAQTDAHKDVWTSVGNDVPPGPGGFPRNCVCEEHVDLTSHKDPSTDVWLK